MRNRFACATFTSIVMTLCTIAAAVEPGSQPPPEMVQAAKKFEAAVMNNRAEEAMSFPDGDALVDRACKGIAMSPEARKGYAAAGAQMAPSFVGPMLQAVQAGATYKFVHVLQKEKRTVAVFRILTAGGVVDYYLWEMEKNPAGEVRFVDQFDIAKGEWASQVVHRFFLAGVIAMDKSAAEKLGAKEKLLIDNLPKFQEMAKASTGGDNQKVLDIYATLPEELKKEKTCQVYRLSAASQLGIKDFPAMAKEFEKYYPNDPALDFFAMSAWTQMKDYTKAHQAVERLGVFIGGDSYLESQQGEVDYSAGTPADLVHAEAWFKKALANEPGLTQAGWGLVAVYLKQKDYAKVSKELTELETKNGIQVADLTKIALYADYVKSSDYKKWMAGRKTPATRP